MKTTHTPEVIHDFLLTSQHAQTESIHALAEGHIAQALSFETEQGDKFVLRIAPRDDDFLHDKYAFEMFGTQLPIPRVREIGKFDDTSYFCISNFVEGVPSDALKQAEIDAMQPEILRSYAALFSIDVSNTSGYGPLDVMTGNGKFATWRARMEDELDGLKPDKFRTQAKNIGLNVGLVDKLMAQAKDNLSFAPEIRGLIHGDLGFDNMLVHDGKVVAFIDWAHVGYGDWMYDYSKFDFWWPGRHDDKHEFAIVHRLDAKNLNQREALYWASTALTTISFADRFKNEKMAGWLRENVPKRLVTE